MDLMKPALIIIFLVLLAIVVVIAKNKNVVNVEPDRYKFAIEPDGSVRKPKSLSDIESGVKKQTEGEKVLAKTKMNSFVFFCPFAIIGLYIIIAMVGAAKIGLEEANEALTGLFVALVALLIAGIVMYRTTYLLITNKRIMGRTGVIWKHHLTSTIRRVDAVATTRGLFGAIFGFATISVFVGRATYRFHCIANYREIESILNAAVIEAQSMKIPVEK